MSVSTTTSSYDSAARCTAHLLVVFVGTEARLDDEAAVPERVLAVPV